MDLVLAVWLVCIFAVMASCSTCVYMQGVIEEETSQMMRDIQSHVDQRVEDLYRALVLEQEGPRVRSRVHIVKNQEETAD